MDPVYTQRSARHDSGTGTEGRNSESSGDGEQRGDRSDGTQRAEQRHGQLPRRPKQREAVHERLRTWLRTSFARTLGDGRTRSREAQEPRCASHEESRCSSSSVSARRALTGTTAVPKPATKSLDSPRESGYSSVDKWVSLMQTTGPQGRRPLKGPPARLLGRVEEVRDGLTPQF